MFSKSAYGHNVLRWIHDLLVTGFVFAVILLFNVLFGRPLETSFVLLLGPFIISSIYFATSLFGQFRTPKFYLQVLVITLSVAVSWIVTGLLAADRQASFLFYFFSWAMLIGPRFYLNLNRRQNSSVARLAFKNKGAVLVVGGAGYIGTHLIDILLKEKYSVRVLDRLMYDKSAIAPFIEHPNFEFIEGDATEISKLVSAVTDCTAVIHLAGLVGDPACAVDADFTRHENIIATRMVREAAKSAGVSRFIFASSCSVYGASDEIVDETSPLNPVSLYALTKIDSEKELMAANSDDFHVTILRFATVFGDSRRPRFDLVGNLFAAQAFNDKRITVIGPSQWRPFVHCRDLARAIATVLRAPSAKVHGEVFNVGDDRLNLTIGQLGEKVAKTAQELGLKVELHVSENITDRRNYRVAFGKIKNVLSFDCQYDIESGTREILENFKKGFYKDYKNKEYSNLETTKTEVNLFYDPIHATSLYRPVGDGKSASSWS